MNKRYVIAVVCTVALMGSCSSKSAGSAARSMDGMYATEGKPVTVRTVAGEPFSVYLAYPTVLNSRSESTAYAALSDVVRSTPVKVGTFVKRDQVILSFSHDNAAYQQAKLSFENASTSWERSKALFAEAGISRQDFDNITMKYELAKASFRSASDMIDVKAPIDGYLTRLNVRTTENVRPGAALFTISNQDGFEARFYVGADEIKRIRTGARARVEESGEVLEGSIIEVSMIQDSEKKAFPVTAFFGGKSRVLVSGMSVDVSVETYHSNAAIVVSRSELSRSGSEWTTFVVNGDVAKKVDVVVGREQDLELEIVGGLKKGDLLISEGQQGLSEGARIKVVGGLTSL